MNRITQKALLRVGFRLTLLQSTWFEGGMQNIGLSYCLIPGLRAIYPEPAALRAAIERYQIPFNTHPFLVGVIAGGVLRLEEQHRPEAEIASYMQNGMGILAALGDPFFRSALPTFVAVTACLAAIFGGVLAGIITLLLLFNVVHFVIRFFGVSFGYEEGLDVLKRMATWLSPNRTLRIKTVSAMGVGLTLAASVFRFGSPNQFVWQGVAASLIGGGLAISLIRWKRLQQYAIPTILVLIILIEVTI
jgi:mannose PTS system EIID component